MSTRAARQRERARRNAQLRGDPRDRDMIDAIREMLGLGPLYYDAKNENYGYIAGAFQIHDETC